MNNQIDRIQIQGNQRKEILERLARQLEEWEFKMPPVEPLVMEGQEHDHGDKE